MTEENKSMDKGRKLLIGLIIVLLLLTAGAYFFGVYYFTGHFLPGSQVNGFNCSYMTEDETENLLKQKTCGAYKRGRSGGNHSRRNQPSIYIRWQCQEAFA